MLNDSKHLGFPGSGSLQRHGCARLVIEALEASHGLKCRRSVGEAKRGNLCTRAMIGSTLIQQMKQST